MGKKMISEQELAKLSYPGAPDIITDEVPGPKTMEVVEKSYQYESMARGAGRFPFVLDEGLGATIKDPDGNTFIDLTAGVAVNNVGRNHPRVIAAIESQMRKLMHGVEITSTKRVELAEKVSNVMPEGLRGKGVSYFTQGGSGAVETAIKFAQKITGRSQIVAFHGAYHGVWCGSGALTVGDGYRLGPFISGVIHAPYAYCYRCPFNLEYPSCDLECAKYVDHLLNTPYTAADDVAALIIEAQQGEGGYLPPPPGYLEKIKEACEKHGALFIADEVQAGAGRTGKMWAIEHSDVIPDMMTWGKGMGGDLPLGGLTLRNDLAEKIPDGCQPNTFAGNSLSAVVCMTNIDILNENDGALMNRAAEIGEEVKERIAEAARDSRIIGDVRGRGFMIGVELVKDKESKEPLELETMEDFMVKMLNRGLLAFNCGRYNNVLRFMPSLIITREYAEKSLDILLEVTREIESAI